MDFALKNKIDRRLRQLKRDGVKFISGTIAPSEASIDEKSIESIERAVQYYRERGGSSLNLSVQPKWMGSRGQLYLFRDKLQESFYVTRNGFTIKYGSGRVKNIDKSIKHWYNKFFKDKNYVDYIEVILDGELMPWNAVGEGLIQRSFVGYSIAVDNELSFLEENGFEVAQTTLEHSTGLAEYNESSDTDKSKNPLRETYELFLSNMSNVFVGEQKEAIDEFKNQLNLYNVETDPYYVAFDIIRMKRADGSINVDNGWMASTQAKYNALQMMWPREAKDVMKKIDALLLEESNHYQYSSVNIDIRDIFKVPTYLSESNMFEAYLKEVMEILMEVGFEGFMLKPDYPEDTEAVHCMKVRNPKYLKLIYGHDYDITDESLEHHISKKRTAKKRKLSHNEYRLGKKMLKLNESSPTYDEDFEKIAKAILFEIEEESTVDHRL